MGSHIRRVAVWSGWLRVSHWSIAVATVALLLTGWLIRHSPAVAAAAADVHYLAAALMVFALALRVFLGLFGAAAERFEHLLPKAAEWPAARASLLFYLTLGRAPQPNWYAHNPLWKPPYLLLIVVLLLLTATGWVMPERPLWFGVYLPSVHLGLAHAVAMFTLLHLFSVVLQDLKGTCADVSAMLNGHRYFSVDKDALVKPDLPQVSVRLDDLGRR